MSGPGKVEHYVLLVHNRSMGGKSLVFGHGAAYLGLSIGATPTGTGDASQLQRPILWRVRGNALTVATRAKWWAPLSGGLKVRANPMGRETMAHAERPEC